MEITILLSTANRAASLKQTLLSLAALQVPRGQHCTLIVVDNASTDSTRDVCESIDFRNMGFVYAYEPRRGRSFAHNTGISMSSGEIVLFLDDDVRPPPNWIKEMCAPIISGKADAVVGGIALAPHLKRNWMTKLLMSMLASTENLNAVEPDLVGGNFCVSRKVFEKVPSFDTELGPGALGFYDDTLFSFQIKKAGFRISQSFNVVSEHHFDEDRLLRTNWLRHGEQKGRSLAYLRYHWLHKKMEFPEKGLIRSHLSLAKNRVKRKAECKNIEGITDWELTLVSHTQLYKQFIKERKRPRNYEQFGLVKLS